MKYLPHIAIGGGLAAIIIAARSYLKGPRCRWSGSCRVAVIGDSITAGGAYVDLLSGLLPRYSFDTFGDVGAGTAALNDTLLRDVIPGRYDEIIIQGGMNDIGRAGAAEYILGNLERMVRAAKGSGARVILLSLTPWIEQAQLVREINKLLRFRSFFWGVDRYVDVWTPLADDRGGLRSSLVGDRMLVHPNLEGSRLLADAILRRAY